MQKMLAGQKFASDTKVQLVIHQCVGQQPASFFASGIQKIVDRWDKCLNKLGRYLEKWNTSVLHLRGNISLLSSFVLFSHSYAAYHQWIIYRYTVLSSKKFLCMFKIKFHTKRIFRIFPILRINEMAPFVTYLSNDPLAMVLCDLVQDYVEFTICTHNTLQFDSYCSTFNWLLLDRQPFFGHKQSHE